MPVGKPFGTQCVSAQILRSDEASNPLWLASRPPLHIATLHDATTEKQRAKKKLPNFSIDAVVPRGIFAHEIPLSGRM